MPHPLIPGLPPSPARRGAVVAALAALLAAPAGAQVPAPAPTLVASAAPAGTGTDWVQATQRWLDAAVRQRDGSTGGMPLRMEVTVGELDPRLRLAPCNRVEPYLPVGARLWGRTRLGLRCVDGASPWNVFLPVTVKAWGPAWVLTRPVASGAVLTEADAVQAEVDWAAEASPVAAAPDQWVGQVAARALTPGLALRQAMVRAPSVFRAGAQVRVMAQGPGFAVASTGQALSEGTVGQTVRIRMDNGKVISGIVGESGTVDVLVQ